MDEVNLVQQLVFCIERAYRIPDYGIWERGSKYNTNTCELHARLAFKYRSNNRSDIYYF